MRLIRSLLFAPANRHDLLKKLPRYPTDAVAIDLEDATPENEKAAARDSLPTNVTDFRISTKIGFLIAKEAPRKQLVNLMPIDFNFEIPPGAPNSLDTLGRR